MGDSHSRAEGGFMAFQLRHALALLVAGAILLLSSGCVVIIGQCGDEPVDCRSFPGIVWRIEAEDCGAE